MNSHLIVLSAQYGFSLENRKQRIILFTDPQLRITHYRVYDRTASPYRRRSMIYDKPGTDGFE
jgi:hypothetical protein